MSDRADPTVTGGVLVAGAPAVAVAGLARWLAGHGIGLSEPGEEARAAVLVVGDPATAAPADEGADGSLPGRAALAVARWERLLRRSVESAQGRPTYVLPVDGLVPASGSGEDGLQDLLAWLADRGCARPPARDPRAAPYEAGAPSPRRDGHAEPGPVLGRQRRLYEDIVAMRGGSERFSYQGVDESPWTSGLLGGAEESVVLWGGFEWLAREASALLAEGGPTASGMEWAPYPVNATLDTAAYHEWLRARGDDPRLGNAGGIAPAATAPPPRGEPPQFSVVVPCHRPPLWALDRCVSSVLRQKLASFELCICDDAGGDPAVTARLDEARRHDPRVKIAALESAGGISAATNRAIELATGRYLVFLDHDDELAPDALAALASAVGGYEAAHGVAPDILYSDEDKIDESGYRVLPSFKLGWSPDLLLSTAYLCHVFVARRQLVRELGGLRTEFDGAQDYDLMLRASEHTDQVVHVPEVLYHWRILPGSAAGDPSGKPWALAAGRRALEAAVERRNLDAAIRAHEVVAGAFHLLRRPRGDRLVTVVVPFRDEGATLAGWYRALLRDPGYDSFELLLVDNGSVLPETRAVVAELSRDSRVRVLGAPGPFDFAAINNEAASVARGDLLLFMNNDVEARSPGWLAAMVGHAERDEVGAVGARLVYPDGALQHVGIAVGLCGSAASLLQGLQASDPGYLALPTLTRNCSAVTAACMMTRRSLFEELGGFSAELPISLNDVDYCLRLRERGYLVVFTPVAELVHEESRSRGHVDDLDELEYFRSRWRTVLVAGDPYYNPNLGRFDCHCRLPREGDAERWASWLSELGELSTR